MPGKTPEKRRQQWRSWYERHNIKAKDYYRKKAKRRRKEIKDWYTSYKSKLSCTSCGESHPSCLEFHHKSPSEKDNRVSQMINRGLSPARVLREIEKCIVLCANCHRKLHDGAL